MLRKLSMVFSALLGIMAGFFLWTQNALLIPGHVEENRGDDIIDHFPVRLKPVLPHMVRIPAGTLMMGAAENDSRAFTNEKPRHKVTIGYDYEIGKYEVSFREYDAFARATARRLPDDNGWGRGGRRPVINVSWHDATAYALWLSTKTGQHYRLPSEAEWEYAARGNSSTIYWWGDQLGRDRAQCSDCEAKQFGNRTAISGTFEANRFGIHDTAGNVTEWTLDCYQKDYQHTPTDGSPAQSPDCRQRVIRGGAWYNKGITLRSSHRSGLNADKNDNNGGGFRLLRQLNKPTVTLQKNTVTK